MEQQTEIETVSQNLPVLASEGGLQMFLDKSMFEQSWRAANLFSKTDLVPVHYKNKPENCMIALNWAFRLKVDPILLMQKTYIIQGKPGMEATLVIALVNSKGPFTGPIQWTFEGDGANESCTAYANHRQTGECCKATVTWKMVELEGWNKKPGSKWNTLRKLMFQYRSATFLAKLYCPEVLMGFSSVEELEDITDRPEKGDALEESSLEKRLPKVVVNTAIEADVTGSDAEAFVVEAEPVVEDKPKRTRKSHSKEDPIAEQPDPIIPPGDIDPPASRVAPEERYYCNGCDNVFGKLAGLKKSLCPKCLCENITDRMA